MRTLARPLSPWLAFGRNVFQSVGRFAIFVSLFGLYVNSWAQED